MRNNTAGGLFRFISRKREIYKQLGYIESGKQNVPYICHQPTGRYTQNCSNECVYLSKHIWKINTYHMCFQKAFTVWMFTSKRLLNYYFYCIMYLHYYVNMNITRHIIYFHKQVLEVVVSIALKWAVLHRNHRSGS